MEHFSVYSRENLKILCKESLGFQANGRMSKRLVEEDGSISSLVLMQKNKKTIRSVNEKLNDGDKIKIMPTAAGG